jgi:YggT family protein
MIGVVDLLLQLLTYAILAEVILSWLMYAGVVKWSPFHPVPRVLGRITAPILDPIRKLMPPWRYGLDFSPFVALVIIQVVRQVLWRM